MRSPLSVMMSPAALGSADSDLTVIDSILEVRARTNPFVLKLLLSECSITVTKKETKTHASRDSKKCPA